MKIIITFLMIFCIEQLHSQKSTRSHFFIDGQKFVKQIKYVMYDFDIDRKKDTNDKIYFYIKGETFEFLKKENKIDTCNIKYLKKIKFSKVKGLLNEEFLFYKQKIKQIKNWKKKMIRPMPITKNHNYFKVIILEKHKDKVLKYDVDWTYTGTRGFKVN